MPSPQSHQHEPLMIERSEKKLFIRYFQTNILWSFVLLLILFIACSPEAAPATQTTLAATNTETPAGSPTQISSTPTSSPIAESKIYPTLPPAPTSFALYFLRPGQPLTLTSIRMIDEQNGWGIDSDRHILRTRDGGYTWKDVTPYYAYSESKFSADGFFALDAENAWATTPNTPACSVENFNCTSIPNTSLIWHTIDGGTTWQGQFICLQSLECSSFPLIVTENHVPMSLQFVDTQTGWLFLLTSDGPVFHYRLYRTTDGGTHWSAVMDRSNRDSSDDPQEKNVIGLGFQDARIGWMGIAESTGISQPIADWSMYRSTDAGITWNKNALPTPEPLPESFVSEGAYCGVLDMRVLPPNSIDVTFHCYSSFASDSGHSFYFYYHSFDGGEHWVTWQETADLQFVDELLGWRLRPNESAYNLEQTRDSGVTWTKIKTIQWRGTLDFIDDRVGWILASTYTDNAVALVHTTNGGKGWDEIHPVVAAR